MIDDLSGYDEHGSLRGMLFRRGHVSFTIATSAVCFGLGDAQHHVRFHLRVLVRNDCTPVDMTSRINIARPAGRGGYSPDPHGLSNNRPSSAGYRAANPDEPLERIREFGKQVEDNVEIYAQPLKPHLPAIGRFLIVVTFIEDSIRILTQWSDQLWYLQK